ncbi:MAG: HEAT repeat domain-containing protein [Planctomycetota bacterium]
MPNVDELISQLRDFRTRSAAKTALLEKGEKAVDPLVQALNGPYDSVRWTAATILGELQAKPALPHLVEALKDDEIRSAAEEALQHITGEDFGDDYDAWKRWLDMGEAGNPEGPTVSAQPDGDLVNQAVYNTEVSAEQKPGGWVLRVPLGNRHQDVTLNLQAKDSDGVPLLVAYTRCGPAQEKHYEWALRQNVRMSAGAIAVTDVENKPEFVIVDVLVREAVTPRMLIESVRRVARKGDQLENALTKADEY